MPPNRAAIFPGQIDKTARHIGRAIAYQPRNSLRHLFRLAAALHRDGRGYAIHPSRFTAGRMHLGIDKSRAYAIDANALCRNLERQADGQ